MTWTSKSPKVGPLPDVSPRLTAGFGSRHRYRLSRAKFLASDHSHRPFSLRSFLRFRGGACSSEHATPVPETGLEIRPHLSHTEGYDRSETAADIHASTSERRMVYPRRV